MSQDTVKVVQISDCHLFSDKSAELRGVVTWDRFEAILSSVAEQLPKFDLLVISGDTADDERREVYEAVRERLDSWLDRVRIIPGNHDQREGLLATFPQPGQSLPGYATFSDQIRGWRVIGLDTQLPGQVPGAVSDQQLIWLREQLGEEPTLVFMHHPPIPVFCDWLDKIGLVDGDEFASFVEDHPTVRLVACGHVHQEVTATLHQATVMTVPAVGPQFVPRAAEVTVEAGRPAARLLELGANGQWATQILYA